MRKKLRCNNCDAIQRSIGEKLRFSSSVMHHIQEKLKKILMSTNEPPCGKTNNEVSDEVLHKPTYTITEES